MEQKEIKKITLSELIDVANKYNSGEWDIDKISEYGNSIIINTYIPLKNKLIGITDIMTNYMYNDYSSYEEQNISLQKYLFFKVLLEKYAMIDIKDEDITYSNYDLLYPLYAPFIISYCEFDYNNYKEILNNTIRSYQNDVLFEVLSTFDAEELRNAAIANKEMIDELNKNKEIIDKLNNIAIMNDPGTAKVANELKKMAIENIKEIQNNIK